MTNQKAKYRISVIAEMLNIHPQTIRTYEKMGFLKPQRSKGNSRLFSDADVRTIERIQVLTRDLGVNLAGVEIILRMRSRIETMQTEAQRFLTSLCSLLENADHDKKENIGCLIKECKTLFGDDTV
jgi:MerR family transcriptional regulator, heat shock protein HspR